MKNLRRTLVLCAFSATASLGQDDASKLYLETVKPALEQQCLGCHGIGNTFAKLDLTTREKALTGGNRGPAIEPGDPGTSLLVKALEQGDPRLAMPPGGPDKKLTAETIDAIREWIAGGAPYAEGEVAQSWDYEEEDLWAFQPVRNVSPPTDSSMSNRSRSGSKHVAEQSDCLNEFLIR